MINHNVRLMLSIALFVPLTACVTPPPETSFDGLKLNEKTGFATVYVKPNADISSYSSISLADCQVAFKDNWQRDQNRSRSTLDSRINQKDVDKIKNSLAKSCNDSFKSALEEKPAYTLVDVADSDGGVLLIKPSIIDLDINAPDVQSVGMNRSYTTSSGEMTLFMELYDAATGEILARVIDRKKGLDNSRLQWTNSVTNKADADRNLSQWTGKLRESLDQIRAQPKMSAP